MPSNTGAGLFYPYPTHESRILSTQLIAEKTITDAFAIVMSITSKASRYIHGFRRRCIYSEREREWRMRERENERQRVENERERGRMRENGE